VKPSRFLSLPQAAREARVSQRVVLAAIHRHSLPATLHLNRWWITPEDLAAWRRRTQQRSGPGRAA